MIRRADVAQLAAHFLGKEEVPSSNLGISSINNMAMINNRAMIDPDTLGFQVSGIRWKPGNKFADVAQLARAAHL